MLIMQLSNSLAWTQGTADLNPSSLCLQVNALEKETPILSISTPGQAVGTDASSLDQAHA